MLPPVCEGSTITIQFQVTNGNGSSAHFTNSTDYTAYLSNSSGSFAFASQIAFTNATAPVGDGSSVLITQSLTIPSGSVTGSGYRISIGSSNPGAGGSGINPSASFTINALPVVPDQTSATCSGVAFTVTPPGIPAGTTYTWSAPAGTGFTGGVPGTDQANISGTLTNTTTSPVTATYTVTPKSGACAGNPFTVTVTVDPAPIVSDQTAAICSGAGFTITPPGVLPGTTYTWSAPAGTGFTGGAPGTNQGNISGTLTNTTSAPVTATYTVTPKSGTCAGNPFSVTVTINPTPTIFTVSAGAGGNYCAGGAGVPILLSGSETGISYELKLNDVSTGIIRTGDGAALNFGNQTSA